LPHVPVSDVNGRECPYFSTDEEKSCTCVFYTYIKKI